MKGPIILLRQNNNKCLSRTILPDLFLSISLFLSQFLVVFSIRLPFPEINSCFCPNSWMVPKPFITGTVCHQRKKIYRCYCKSVYLFWFFEFSNIFCGSSDFDVEPLIFCLIVISQILLDNFVVVVIIILLFFFFVSGRRKFTSKRIRHWIRTFFRTNFRRRRIRGFRRRRRIWRLVSWGRLILEVAHQGRGRRGFFFQQKTGIDQADRFETNIDRARTLKK